MSAAAATAPDAAAPKKGKKKLIMILAVVLLLVLAGGGAAMFMLKKKHADADEEGGAEASEHVEKKTAKFDPKHVPTFVPLDPFTVNLADREAERYAQIGITLEVDEAKTGDLLKAYMPAIRNNILMLLAQKSAADLLDREGKEKLAREIRREASRPLGIELEDEDEEHEEADAKPAKKKKKKKVVVESPITSVVFSNFIIQ
jgi:flagellar FliL protein